jgi:hypothetical protein
MMEGDEMTLVIEWFEIVADMWGRMPVAAECFVASLVLIAGSLAGWVIYGYNAKTLPPLPPAK